MAEYAEKQYKNYSTNSNLDKNVSIKGDVHACIRYLKTLCYSKLKWYVMGNFPERWLSCNFIIIY